MEFDKALEGFFLAKKADGFSASTIQSYYYSLTRLSDFLGNPDVNKITSKDLQRFFVWLRTDYIPNRKSKNVEPLSGRSIEITWTAIRSFFAWCVIDHHIKKRPDLEIKRPEYTTEQREPFTQEEIKLLLANAEYTKLANTKGRKAFKMRRPTADRDIAIIMILLDTGIRIGELCRLTVGDVDIQSGSINVKPWGSGQKTKGRTVYIAKSAHKVIWKYLTLRGSVDENNFLFLDNHNKLPANRNSIRLMLSDLGDKAGIPDVMPHRFRHSFCYWYIKNGGDPFTLIRLAGWSEKNGMSMAMKYVKMATNDAHEMHNRASPVDNWRL